MKTNHIIFMDGTWVDKERGQLSNIGILYKSILKNKNQKVYYSSGVGSSKNKIIKYLGGIFGYGTTKGVKDMYFRVSKSFREGDTLCGVGFSRGSYQIRSLMGIIGKWGIAKEKKVAKKILRSATWGKKLFFLRFTPKESQVLRPNIDCLVVFDTIGSLGIPVDVAGIPFQKMNLFFNEFVDRKPHKKIQNVIHLVSVDEKRASFIPTLFEVSNQRVKQICFAGDHSDIGGGHGNYARDLSNLVLPFAIKFLKKHGQCLFDDKKLVKYQGNYLGKVHDLSGKFPGSITMRFLPGFLKVSETTNLKILKDKKYNPKNISKKHIVCGKNSI